MKKLSLRLRLTLVISLLLLLCCLGLTLALNQSAGIMANTIESSVTTPAYSVEEAIPLPDSDTTIAMSTISATDNAKTIYMKTSVAYMLLIVAAGGILTWFITGRALRPLVSLSKEMQHRTVLNLSEALPVPESHDEISSLTESFNEMNQKLSDSFSAQKRFSQSAAHELRTPLTVLKAKVDVFGKKSVHTPEEYEALLALVSRHTDRMTELVSDLLNLTNLDALSCDQTISVAPMLEEIKNELQPLAEEKEITVSLSACDCCIQGNRSLLYRALSNLAENAIKYNLPHGSVKLSAREENNTVYICISDTGPGIPEEHKPLIFEPFYRVDKSRSRQMGGAGLGLATVKAVLEKHHGEIRLTDRPGGGCIFTVTLPKNQ